LYIELLDDVLKQDGLDINKKYKVIRTEESYNDIFYIVINDKGVETSVHDLLAIVTYSPDKWVILRQKINHLLENDVRYSDGIPQSCLEDILILMDDLDRKYKVYEASGLINNQYKNTFVQLSEKASAESIEFRKIARDRE
jgi:hypothetical protein